MHSTDFQCYAFSHSPCLRISLRMKDNRCGTPIFFLRGDRRTITITIYNERFYNRQAAGQREYQLQRE